MSAGTLNILVEQGCDFSQTVILKDGSGVPIDISNCSFAGKIRKNFTAATAIATFSFTKIDSPNGVLRFSLTAATTQAMQFDASTKNRISLAFYDITMTDADDITFRLLEGVANLSRGVTS